MVESACGNKIKVLKTDNGKEYVNKSLEQLCEECGIQMQHSMPYTQQQNGVTERKNRVLKEMATCMMEEKYLNPNILDEDINAAAYVKNIAPHKALGGKTPYEAWSGHKL